jgi:hypothetical protein
LLIREQQVNADESCQQEAKPKKAAGQGMDFLGLLLFYYFTGLL